MGRTYEDEDLDGEIEAGVGRQFTILYGTQTGNAQDVAERIQRQARRRHIATHVCAMDEYDISDLINESLVVIILGTTGNGDFPTAALPFWRFLLRSDLPEDILSDLTFATFGLGDSSYKRFCWPVRKINKRLRGLGAVELVASDEADDQHYLGIEGSLRPWLDRFWAALEEVLPPSAEEPIAEDATLPPLIEVRLGEKDGKEIEAKQTLQSGWRWASLTRNERLTQSDHWQDVRLIELDVKRENGHALEYRPTDVLSVVPENAASDVDAILQRMGWTDFADAELKLASTSPDASIPARLVIETRLTLRRLFTAHLDFRAVPRPSFFERILPFTPSDHMQREKLQEYCTPGEGADEMYEYAIRVRRTILEVLLEFDAVKVPLAHVLDVFPWIQRREFSIASAAPPQTVAMQPDATTKVQLAVAIVDYKTRLKERRKGVCTSWLAQLEPEAQIPIHIAPSAMATHALRNHTTPAIFVGPGTGVAPVRSAIWTRFQALGESETGMRAADNLCFFGCRNRAKDFLFGGEWDTLSGKGCIEVHLAASRDQDEKVYVQDLIQRQAERVWDIVGRRRGLVYICGSAGKMPQAVRARIVEICASQGGMTESDAERYVDQMESEGRWIEECWD